MPLFWLSLAFLTGILFGDFFGWSEGIWLWLSAAFLVLALLVWRLPGCFAEGLRQATRFPRLRFFPEWTQPSYSVLWFLVALCLGGLRFASQQPQWSPELIAWHNDQDVPLVIEGVVIAPPEEGDGVTRLRLQAERLRKKDELLFQEVKGVILARVPPLDGWRYGDRVRLEGKLETPPVSETFSYREYLARQGIYSYFSCYVCQGCPTPIDQECARLLQHDQANPIRAAIYALRQKAYHPGGNSTP